MAWINAFDLGDCTVKVNWYDDANNPTVLFDGILGKGESVNFFHSSREAELVIAVSNAGEVSLSCNTDYDWFGYGVEIIPPEGMSYSARLRDISFSGGATFAMGYIADPATTAGVDLLEFESIDPALPDPMDLSALTGALEFVGCYAAE